MTEIAQLKPILESLLFVARKPLSLEELEKALELPQTAISQALDELIAEYESKGIKIFRVAGGNLMGTDPANAQYVEKILNPRVETTLSPQALETLAIIAYKQPVTRAEIERLRGVASDWVVETLVNKKLIKEVGRSEAVGHPYLDGTTQEFLRHFGVHNLEELPPLPVSETEQEQVFKTALHETADQSA